MRLLQTLVGVFLILFLHYALAYAESPAEQIQRRYGLVETMRSSFTQILIHKDSGAIEKKSGTLLFKKPLLVQWQTIAPSPEILVVGKKDIWDVFPDEEVAYKYPLSVMESSTNIIRVITGQSRLNQDFSIEEQGTEQGWKKLALYPNEPVQSMVEATLWIEPMTSVIKKILVLDFYGNRNEIVFTQQDIGVTITDKEFDYTPPSKFTIEDRTNSSSAPSPLLGK